MEVTVMDIWQASCGASELHTPHAAILYDQLHVLRQVGRAMDQVRKAEHKQRTDHADRTFIKSRKYVLLSHRTNLSPEKRRALATQLAATRRLYTAYVLKDQFGQLWEYRSVA